MLNENPMKPTGVRYKGMFRLEKCFGIALNLKRYGVFPGTGVSSTSAYGCSYAEWVVNPWDIG